MARAEGLLRAPALPASRCTSCFGAVLNRFRRFSRTYGSHPSFYILRKKMARAEGFEPPTAWFVARYSIQLSYARAVNSSH